MDKTCEHYESCGMEFCMMGIDCPEYKKKDKPILFNTEMVKAILEGRKTQTRRIIKQLPDGTNRIESLKNGKFEAFWGGYAPDIKAFIDGSTKIKSPLAVGDTLWVRETWTIGDLYDGDIVECDFHYKAGDTIEHKKISDDLADKLSEKLEYFEVYGNGTNWIPSIHMPREAARLFLKVTNVRVERLQDITIDGIEQEGIPLTFPIVKMTDSEHLKKFISLWDSTIDMKNHWMDYSWGANPWVWVIEFERIR